MSSLHQLGVGPSAAAEAPADRRAVEISVVIPVYNEEATLAELCRRLDAVVRSVGGSWEAIFVDDGSRDGSLALLLDLRRLYPYLKVVSLARNFGHQPALTAGIEHARGAAVVLMDGDLQDVPEAIPEFIARWREGFGVVYAIRTKRKEGLLKRAAFDAFYRLQHRLSRIDTPVQAGIFSLLDARVVEVLLALPERNRYFPGLRAFAGFRQTGVVVERDRRYAGNPRVSIGDLVKLALDGVFAFSTAPLRFVFYNGVLLSLASLAIALAALYLRYVRGVTVLSWAFGLSTTFFFGGIQLMSLGIIGEYVGRIYEEVKRRPYFVVQRTYGFSAEPPDAAGR